MTPNLIDSSHRRLNPLTGEWVVVSPHRTKRPWQGQVEDVPPENKADYDPICYLCPGNARAGGKRNEQYTSTYVFDNDFPGLQQEITHEADDAKRSELLVARPERGICRVGCFSPKHNVTLADMPVAEIKMVVGMWAEQFKDLGGRDFIQYVQIFENRGAMMGASNPHPHCQIWGTESLPNEPAKEQASMHRYMAEKRKCLLCDYLEIEVSSGERLIFQNDDFAVVVPFWAIWPFETLIVSRNHIPDIASLSDTGKDGLAAVLQKIVRGYDRLFNAPFPYSMGFHQQPCSGKNHPEWHFHGHFYPPLLRSASIKKFMVGFELLGSPQRDILPESAAERLRAVCKP
ncbi:MAG: UDP-glucose--hexose-1-phosphate uridylyltransferase [Acidobacteriales bacterium]|nr:UDP-glucose--hexose-1-phosphate uridylyltransferase [Terriglobales bacterium]